VRPTRKTASKAGTLSTLELRRIIAEMIG